MTKSAGDSNAPGHSQVGITNDPKGPSKHGDADSRSGTLSPSTRLRQLLLDRDLTFLIEGHNGLSAKIAQESGFVGIWASSLTISASLGVRDSNEASWTQVLEILEFMADSVSIPILMDGDTGHGNFNTMRRLTAKLCQRGIAGVCIEDKLYPKTNSLLADGRQDLADVQEFCGKIKAAKDSQSDPNFSVVARTEALIAGFGLDEALSRAEHYAQAGADAVLLHSRRPDADEILRFMAEWGQRCPVVIVPTTYYRTPVDVYRQAGVSTVIWANHLLRASVAAMRQACRTIKQDQTPVALDGLIAPVRDIFDLVGNKELAVAERRYLAAKPVEKALIIAASRGDRLGNLTKDKPKCMIDVRGKPILRRLSATLNACGISDIGVVGGYKEDKLAGFNYRLWHNKDYANSGEVASLYCGRTMLDGPCMISYGDILFRPFIVDDLLACSGDIVLVVDGLARGQDHRQSKRDRDFIQASKPFTPGYNIGSKTAQMVAASHCLGREDVDGEWIGLARCSAKGTSCLRQTMDDMVADGSLDKADMIDLFSRLHRAGTAITIVYIAGDWLDVDDVFDLAEARNFALDGEGSPVGRNDH